MTSITETIQSALAAGKPIFTDNAGFCNDSAFAAKIETMMEQEPRKWYIGNSQEDEITASVQELRDVFKVSTFYEFGCCGESLMWSIKG